MDFLPINWKLISHPINWVVVVLMLLIAGCAAHFILPSLGIPHADKSASN